MFWDCPDCKEEGCMERIYDLDVRMETAELAECSECGSVFEVENDFSYENEFWIDYSVLGEPYGGKVFRY